MSPADVYIPAAIQLWYDHGGSWGSQCIRACIPVNEGLDLLMASVSLNSVFDTLDGYRSADLTLHAGVAANARIFHLQHLHRVISIPNRSSVSPISARYWTDLQYSTQWLPLHTASERRWYHCELVCNTQRYEPLMTKSAMNRGVIKSHASLPTD